MAIQLESDNRDDTFFQQNLPSYYRNFLKQFKKTSQSFINFHLIFIAILLVEFVLFLSFFSFFTQSSSLAYSLSALFLTFFSYLVLLFYFQAQKSEQLVSLKNQFLFSCRQILPSAETSLEHHLSLAEALSKLSQYLQDFEWSVYKVPPISRWMTSFITYFSAYYYWENVFILKQLLLNSAIDEHLKQIKHTPTNLEVHASLANTYVALSKLYREPIPSEEHPRSRYIRKKHLVFQDYAKTYSRLAIEEFKILNHYASNDPWIHEQMALGYRDLNIPEEQIKEMETLLKLRPQDKEILFQLGTLYFKQGFNAKGLQIYEDLKRTHFKKAEDLLSSYGNSLDIL